MKRLLYAGLLAPLVWSGLVEAQPLTQQQALQRLGEYALLPSSSLDEITASMTTTSLATGVVQPIAGPGPGREHLRLRLPAVVRRGRPPPMPVVRP